ncbi:MAG TPA: hypothetical protein VID72_05985, partial [Ktedonobacterales bacterium]
PWIGENAIAAASHRNDTGVLSRAWLSRRGWRVNAAPARFLTAHSPTTYTEKYKYGNDLEK